MDESYIVYAEIKVNGIRADVVWQKPIPAGIVGAQVRFEFDESWDGLSKTAVFKGCCTKDVLDIGDVVTIPKETVAHVWPEFKIGVYGVNSDGTIGIPTRWAYCGRILDAADPSGDTTSDPTLPVWAQLQEQIKDLKENGFSVDDDKLEEIVQNYLKENPPTQFDPDEETLSLEKGVLSVKTTNEVTEDDPTPITSGAVYNEFSKAVALLKTI